MCKECKNLEQRLKFLKENHYNPKFGDGKKCECGHDYYRHFDSYDDMYPIGCKYCECYTFKQIK